MFLRRSFFGFLNFCQPFLTPEISRIFFSGVKIQIFIQLQRYECGSVRLPDSVQQSIYGAGGEYMARKPKPKPKDDD